MVLNKIDVVPPEDLEALAESVGQHCDGHRPLLISAATSKGLDALLVEVWKQLQQMDEAQRILEITSPASLATHQSS